MLDWSDFFGLKWKVLKEEKNWNGDKLVLFVWFGGRIMFGMMYDMW